MIRQATKEDIGEILSILQTTVNETSFKDLTINPDKAIDYLEEFIDNNQYMAAVEKDGKLIGGMIGTIESPWYSDDLIGYDLGLFILPEYRHGLIATKLILYFIEWCKKNNVKQIRPGISTGIFQVSRLYQNLGFEVTGNNFLMRV